MLETTMKLKIDKPRVNVVPFKVLRYGSIFRHKKRCYIKLDDKVSDCISLTTIESKLQTMFDGMKSYKDFNVYTFVESVKDFRLSIPDVVTIDTRILIDKVELAGEKDLPLIDSYALYPGMLIIVGKYLCITTHVTTRKDRDNTAIVLFDFKKGGRDYGEIKFSSENDIAFIEDCTLTV